MPEQTISQSQLRAIGAWRTASPLTFAVDYNDPNAVDPPVGETFVRQADVDEYLKAQGATSFKHFNKVIGAVPDIVAHVVTLNLAAGVHYSDGIAIAGSFGAFGVNKVIQGTGRVDIIGAGGDEYTPIVAADTITGHQVASADPYIEFAGTPFAGLNLRGKLVVMSTGQIGMVVDHTDSRLNLAKDLSPAPVNGTSTAFVGRPGTILRNALAATPTTKLASYTLSLSDQGHVGSSFLVYDLQLDGMGALSANLMQARGIFYRVIVDHEYQRTELGISPYGRGFQTSGQAIVTLDHCSVVAEVGQFGGLYQPVYSSSRVGKLLGMSLENCYFAGSNYGLAGWNEGHLSLRGGTTLEYLGSATRGACDLFEGSAFDAYYLAFYSSRFPVIKNCPVGIWLHSNAQLARADLAGVVMSDIAGACLRVGSNVIFDISAAVGGGLIDGGGNLDVGIHLDGAASLVGLPTGTDVTGSNGDIRMGDGTLKTYAELTGPGVLTDAFLNIITQ